MLTPKQKSILDFIKSWTQKRGYSPSFNEIKKHFHLNSVSTVHQHLEAIKNKGFLEKQKNQHRNITLTESEKLIQIPLLGTIAAGHPIEAIQNKETIAIPKSKIPSSSEIYALRVTGNSMVDENINDGDIVLIRRQETAENGQKVVALIDNQNATLKKYYQERGRIRLEPANKNMEPIILRNNRSISIQGIVLDVIKEEKPVSLAWPEPKSEIRQYKKLPLNQIICGDSITELKKIPDRSIDLILTDPPYGLNKAGIKNDYDLTLFYSSLPDSYRVLKDNAFYITFFSTKFFPKIFINNPFKYFWNFVLYCPNGQVSSPIGYSKYMTCTVFKKGVPKMNRRNKDIFVDTPGRMVEPDEGFIEHPTPKPKTFISEILKMFSKEGDVILDPFIGSGSTAMACRLTQRQYIGIDLDENYCRLAEKRLKNFKQNLKLF